MRTKRILSAIVLMVIFLCSTETKAQCNTKIVGQNIVQNSDFELGDTLFSSDLVSWNNPSSGAPCGNPDPLTCPGPPFSDPNEYFVHDNADDFNPGSFSAIPSPVSGGNMMLIDAACNPGGIVWEQTVNIMPSTNYYFSLWIASIHPQDPAQLSFEVNGVTLGTLVNAPSTVNTWLFYEDTWNSAALSGPVQLRIREQSGVGCTNGDDFAIDDIQFIPGCQFGADGPVPDLGPDITICGTGGSIVLDPGIPDHPDIDFEWSTGEMTPTITVTAGGTYSVCVDSAGSCLRSDVIVVSSDYSIDLGPDIDLCSPTSVDLDAGFTGPGVTYQWFKDGNLLYGDTNQTLFVNTAGSYSVQVDDPVCGTRSDIVDITSSAAIAVNDTFCGTNSIVNLEVIGPGGYKWYDQPTGGTELATGSTYSPTVSTTTTYYAEDTTSFQNHVGPVPAFSGGFGGGGDPNQWIEFDVFTDITLDSVLVYPVWTNSSLDVGVTIYDITGGTPGTFVGQTITNVSLAYNNGTPGPAIQVPVGIALTAGRTYRMTSEGTGNGGQIWYHQGGASPTWPYELPGIISLVGLSPGEQWSTALYAYFYDWVVSSGSLCDRTPVVAQEVCEPTCTFPNISLNLANPTDLCGGGAQLLEVSAGPLGYNGFLYTFEEAGMGVLKGPVLNDSTYSISVAGNYTITVEDTATSIVPCVATASLQITNTGIPAQPTISGPVSLCEGNNGLYTINRDPNATSYNWELPSSGISVVNQVDTAVTIQFQTDGSFWIKVTPLNPGCGDGQADSIEVIVDPGVVPSIGLNDPSPVCLGVAANFTAVPVNEGGAPTYEWYVNGVAQTNNSTTFSPTNLQAGDTVLVEMFSSETCRTLNRVTAQVIVTGLTASISGATSACSPSTVMLIGTGGGTYEWMESGTPISPAETDDTLIVSSTGNYELIVSNGTCSDTSAIHTVTINTPPSINATPDTATINLGESIGLTVAPTTGLNFGWFNESMASVGTGSSLTVQPINLNGGTVTYYVIGTDANLCTDLDSVVITVAITDLMIPNIITPNGDPHNETFAIQGLLPGSKLEIYNRWGKRVFVSEDYDNQWDGEDISDGLYYVYLKMGITEEEHRGWLQIVR